MFPFQLSSAHNSRESSCLKKQILYLEFVQASSRTLSSLGSYTSLDEGMTDFDHLEGIELCLEAATEIDCRRDLIVNDAFGNLPRQCIC